MLLEIKITNILALIPVSSYTATKPSTACSKTTYSKAATSIFSKTPSTATEESTNKTPFSLAGRGEGYIENSPDALSFGIAELSASFVAALNNAPDNSIIYSMKLPTLTSFMSTAMYALPSSLNVNKDTRLFVSPQGNVENIVVLKGRGNVVSHAIDPQLSPLLVDFSLTFIERDKKTFFRMVISTSDGSFRHDSGLVKVVSGDLKITSTAIA